MGKMVPEALAADPLARTIRPGAGAPIQIRLLVRTGCHPLPSFRWSKLQGYNAEAVQKAQEIIARIRRETAGLRPHYERYCLPAVSRTIEELFGMEAGGLGKELGLGPADKVVSFVLDGLGYLKLESLRKQRVVDLTLFQERGVYIPLTSVFPPTTTTALASLSTGASPLLHGVVGYTLFLQDPGAVVNMIKLATPGAASDALQKLGIKVERFLPVSTLYRRLEGQGVPTYLFLPKYIADSGLSHLLYGGIKETIPYISPSDLFMLLREALRRPGRALLAVYWPTSDTIAHVYGPSSPAFATEVATFFRLLHQEFLGQVRGVTVLITADHGFVDVDPAKDVILCPQHPELKAGLLCPPVGDARAAYLFLRRGHEEEVREFFACNYPDDFLVMTSEEALRRGLWGFESPSPEVRARLGDLVVLARRRKLVLWPREEFKLRGMHGGLTEEELLVPFLALTL